MKTLRLLFISTRPQQWLKNAFLFIPLVFSQQAFQLPSLWITIQAAFVFCLVSGAVYLINDLFDLASDRRHPVKMHRPLAAGLIPLPTAGIAAGVLLIAALAWGYALQISFFFMLLVYLAVQVLYNMRLKQVVILDIFCVSSGFFLRVVAGAAAIQVSISHWLIICSILISMFLALAKRRHELIRLGESEAAEHGQVLSLYSEPLLDQMIALITASCVLSYMLYCISPETVDKFNSDRLISTMPVVLYGILRYLFLINKKNEGGAPEKILFTDPPLLISIGMWGVLCTLVVYGVF